MDNDRGYLHTWRGAVSRQPPYHLFLNRQKQRYMALPNSYACSAKKKIMDIVRKCWRQVAKSQVARSYLVTLPQKTILIFLFLPKCPHHPLGLLRTHASLCWRGGGGHSRCFAFGKSGWSSGWRSFLPTFTNLPHPMTAMVRLDWKRHIPSSSSLA